MKIFRVLKMTFLLTLLCGGTSVIADNKNTPSGIEQKDTDANITGHVVDAKTGEHLAYALVVLKGTTIGTTTDATGHFYLKNLPVGEWTIQASSMGFKPQEKKVVLKENHLVELNFELSEDHNILDEVVVSATRNETSKKSAPIIVNVMSDKLFTTTASIDLSQAVEFQPGLRVDNTCGNCGTTQLRINGLDGEYSQMLIDSRPIISSLGGMYGLEQIPVSMIERVEVIRGGGSALYGSNAIGGVVNVIIKDPIRNAGYISHNTGVFGKNRLENNTSLNASLVSDDNKAGLYVFGMARNRQSYDYSNDGYSDIPKLKTEVVGLRGNYQLSMNSRLGVEYHHIHEFRRGGNNFDRPPHEADIAEELNHHINTGSVTYNYFTPDGKHKFNAYTSLQAIDRHSYFGVDKQEDSYGHTTDQTFVGGVQYTHKMEKLWFMPAELTVGSEYNSNNLKDSYLGLGRDFKQKVYTAGVYGQNEWRTDKLSILAGARLDKQNLIKNAILNPRFNVRYSPTERLGFRASYSSGYRAPQAYNEDLHVDAVGGSLAMIELAKNLKPEYSNSFSISADVYKNFGDVQTNFLVEGFYTTLKDVFTLERIGQNDDGTITYWERRNGDGAKVKGINLEGKIGIPSIFEIQGGFTFQSSKFNEPERWSEELTPQRKMFRAPNNYGYITSLIYFTKRLNLTIFGNYTGSMLVKHTINDGIEEVDTEVNTPTFWDMGSQLTYKFPVGRGISMELSGGMKNILNSFQKDLDKGMLKDSSYIYGPRMPRTTFVGLKILM